MKITRKQLRKVIREALDTSNLLEVDDLEFELDDMEDATIGDTVKNWMNYEDPDGDTDGDGLPNYEDPEPHVSNADDWEVASLDALKKLNDKDMIPSEMRGKFTREDLEDSDGDRWPDRVEKELGTNPEDPKSQPVDDDKDGIADRKGLSKLGAAAERMLNDPSNRKTAAALGTAVAAAAGAGAVSGLKQKSKIKNRPKHQQRKSLK